MDLFFHWIEQLLASTPETYAGYTLLFGLSALLGLTHTFGPGYGKSLLLGVLVADSRRIGHALKMGLIIGITHMADVIILSTISIFLVTAVPLGSYSQMIGLISGFGIFLIGLYRIYRVFKKKRESQSVDTDHDNRGQSETENLITAFLYSLAPCPGAWILFMACLGTGEPIVGVFLLLGFTVGLLVAITGVAVSIVYSLKSLEQFLPEWAHQSISFLSGILVSLLGLWLMFDPSSHAHHKT